MSYIINGKEIANEITDKLKSLVYDLTPSNVGFSKCNIAPKLLVVTSGDAEAENASKVYVKSKRKMCENLGIQFIHVHYKCITPSAVSDLATILMSNDYPAFIIQLPMTATISKSLIYNILYEEIYNDLGDKTRNMLMRMDADGFISPDNIAFTYSPMYFKEPDTYQLHDINSLGCQLPCTPTGVLKILTDEKYQEFIKNNTTALNPYRVGDIIGGPRVVILGRSDLVSKPLEAMLVNYNCKVTMIHRGSLSSDYYYYLKTADIIISAMGNTSILNKPMLHTLGDDIDLSNKTLIDVGINRDINGKLVGDCDPELLEEFGAYTPVPGGVGPMTVACLMANVVKRYLPDHSDIRESCNDVMRDILPLYPYMMK